MLISQQGDPDFVKVLDFGLAKVNTEQLPAGLAGPGPALTKTGTVCGTPKYMAPEQCVSAPVDGRTDLYALGLILYEMLTAVNPFAGKDILTTIRHQLSTPTPPIRTVAPAVEVPAAVEAIVMRLTDKRPEQRYENAAAVLAALAAVSEQSAVTATSGPLRSPRATPAAVTPPAAALADAGKTAGTIELLSTDGTEVELPAALKVAAPPQSPAPTPAPTAASAAPATPPAASAAPVTVAASAAPATPPAASAAPAAPAAPATPAASAAPATPAAASAAPASPQAVSPAPAVAAQAGVGNRSLRQRLFGLLPAAERKLLSLILVPLVLLVPLLFLLFRSGAPAGSDSPAARRRGDKPGPAAVLAPPELLEQARPQGTPALLALAQQYPQDARVLRSLAHTYMAQRDGVTALQWLARATQLNATLVPDGELLQAATLGIGTQESTDAVLTLLSEKLGSRGVDILYTLAKNPGPGRIKAKVSQLLGRPEVRTLASPAAAIALELRAADQCGKKRALLQRAATQGDERSLQQLQALLQTHNCGAYGLADCWSCLRQDDALQRAIAAIEARKPR
jgi:serine/threonine-protein kinase